MTSSLIHVARGHRDVRPDTLLEMAEGVDSNPICADQAWYARWYSYFCTVKNSCIARWLRFFFDAGQVTAARRLATAGHRQKPNTTLGAEVRSH